nr:Remorin, C-terminal protein [Ipomoea trifida]GLL27275.1 Remorin, C-terminal protein [Ipomoea trifida]GLL27276.1 Remorin, C-terminal protein [Ipomoea trifida]GLL35782.1 Remorin, C-terminal protein [Ipomoea trifida]
MAFLFIKMLFGAYDNESRSDKDAAANVSRVVSRRDMATQMSREASPYSSPRRRSSFSSSTPSMYHLWKCRVSIPLERKSRMCQLMNGSP